MSSKLKAYAADHRHLLEEAARQAGFSDPIALDLDEFYMPLIKAAKKRDLLPIDGVLVRDWDPDGRRLWPGMQLGMRFYEIEGIRFVSVRFGHNDQDSMWGLNFVALDRKDYRQLYRIAVRCRRDFEPPSAPPILSPEDADVIWKNTIGYLDRGNLRRIKAYGGKARRGVLFTGTPGNGKTMACRWIWEECRRRRWEWHLVTPDAYRTARCADDAQEAVKALFTVEKCGIVFFDDMDLALRDRKIAQETDDQAVFLGALDGICINEGVVFVFTTNCAMDMIDPAFKRPGRLDLVIQFKAPDANLRRRLIERWHNDIRSHIDLDMAVASTDGYSFAEIDELKNLLIMHFMDSASWSWGWALKQFDSNRDELAARQQRRVGFDMISPVLSSADGN